MKIGERIRELRISKLMTQADLAGEQITRNMLSCIENGSTNPSLSTILYIAGRLNVPAGFLLAEEGDEIVYRKITNLSNIKRAYAAGDLRGCRSLCFSSCPEPDDEICLLLANCDMGIAIEEFWNGRLRSACRYFDEALVYAAKTLYPTDAIDATVRVYFRYMDRISPTLYSDMLDEERFSELKNVSFVASYLDALEGLERGETDEAERFIESAEDSSFEKDHIRIKLMMLRGEYKPAERLLTQLLRSEAPLTKIALYEVLCSLEVCCRECEDFKNAYNYANEKIELLEQLLREN